MNALKTILIIIGSIAVVGGIGLFIFLNTASDATKEELFKDSFMENVDREIYVKCEVTEARKNFLGNRWVISGRFYCTNDRQNYTSQTVTFHFSDGDETRVFNFRLNGAQALARPFQVRIEGHKNARFIYAELIAAD